MNNSTQEQDCLASLKQFARLFFKVPHSRSTPWPHSSIALVLRRGEAVLRFIPPHLECLAPLEQS